jgi:STAM-binding protein
VAACDIYNFLRGNSPNQAGQCDIVAAKDGDAGGVGSTMESVLSLDDGRWLHPAEESCSPLINEAREDPLQLVKQPFVPPVLAQLQQDVCPIPPSKVADPRPGPAISSQDGMQSSDSYQHLHIVGFCADSCFNIQEKKIAYFLATL